MIPVRREGSATATNDSIKVVWRHAKQGTKLGFQNIGVPAVSVPFSSLTGDALVAAVAAEISGYKALGWTDQDIVSFFLDPGRPGSQKYPNLTIELLIRAAEGLLSQLEIANLRRLEIRQSSASGGYFGGSSQFLYLDGREIPKENIE